MYLNRKHLEYNLDFKPNAEKWDKQVRITSKTVPPQDQTAWPLPSPKG